MMSPEQISKLAFLLSAHHENRARRTVNRIAGYENPADPQRALTRG